MRISKGDIVGRLSYNKDILFVVDKIIHVKNSSDIAILKGISMRIEADSPIDDLEKIDRSTVKEIESNINFKFDERIKKIVASNRSHAR